jgi:hypothetical protein
MKLKALSRSIRKNLTEARNTGEHQRQQLKQVLDERQTVRSQAIAAWHEQGAEVFVEWTGRHYICHHGGRLEWRDPYLKDFAYLFGNPWLSWVIAEKPAQIGYSELSIAFCAFMLVYVRSSVGFGCERQGKLQDVMSTRVKVAFDYCEPMNEIIRETKEKVNQQDVKNTRVVTVGGVLLTPFYAIIPGAKGKEAPAGIRSFPAHSIVADEFSLWPPGVLDVATARMGGSDLPAKICRAGSTPSYEGSVLDVQIVQSEREFCWQIQCPHCGKVQFLDAFGNFLRSSLFEEHGQERRLFISPQGQPASWFHRVEKPRSEWEAEDLERAIKTAYIGCQDCGQEISRSNIRDGKFVCVRSGVEMREYSDRVTQSQKVIEGKVAVRLPALARGRFNPAERIRALLKTDNIVSEVQQWLGKAISVSGGKISLELLLACCDRPLPPPLQDREPDLIVMGVDQGQPFYVQIQHWYWQGRDRQDKYQAWKDAYVSLVHWTEVSNFLDVQDLAEDYNVDLIGFDSEPNINDALDFAHQFPAFGIDLTYRNEDKLQGYACDQVNMSGAKTNKKMVSFASAKKREQRQISAPKFQIDRTFFLDNVRNRIYQGNLTIARKIYFDPNDRGNLAYHYTTSERLEEGRWQEGPGQPDHYFHCHSFCNAAVYLSLYETGTKRFSFTTVGWH